MAIRYGNNSPEMMSPIAKNIFRVVSVLVTCSLIALTVQFVLANPRESCSSESVAAWQEILPWFMVTAVLLWAGCFCLPRLQQWLALAALLVCTRSPWNSRGRGAVTMMGDFRKPMYCYLAP